MNNIIHFNQIILFNVFFYRYFFFVFAVLNIDGERHDFESFGRVVCCRHYVSFTIKYRRQINKTQI